MIPLFKSHYSIGKSILTLSGGGDAGTADSIISIAAENNLKKVVLVEDSLTGFLDAHNACASANLDLIFGLRLKCCADVKLDGEKEKKKSYHKIIIFSKNKNGCALLNSIYSAAFVSHGGFIDFDMIKDMWKESDLKLCIPFYDSFLFRNLFTFDNFVPNISFTVPTFFVESNAVPFDGPLRERVESFSKESNFPTQEVQSIYYKNKEDLDAFTTYKLICSRKNFGGAPLLEKPNFDHFSSDQFCWESYLEKNAFLI